MQGGSDVLDPVQHGDIREDFEVISGLVNRPVTTADELTEHLREIYTAVFSVDLGRYDPVVVRGQAAQLLPLIFDLRMSMRDHVADWHRRGFMNAAAQKALRDVFRVARYGSDMLGELLIGYDRADEHGVSRRGFTGQDYNTFVPLRMAVTAASSLPFRTGDVLLMRGLLHNSAAIARIGDTDSQFSHVGMIYIDAQDRHWVVEALIEDGSVISRLEDVLAHHLGRAILFRHPDPQIAAAAAQFIHTLVARSHAPGGKWIPYDFSMRLKRYRQLFCSKLVRYAFLKGSKGKVVLPTFSTRLDIINRDFFQRIGVKTRHTFAPGDLEIEPQLEVVAEWADYRVTSRLRLQDMMMSKFFEWMEKYDYTFRETFPIRLISWFGRLASHLSDESKAHMASVVPKIPVNMNRRTIATIVMLHKTAEEVYHRLERLERDSIERTGRPLHPREVFEALEAIRHEANGHIGYLHASR